MFRDQQGIKMEGVPTLQHLMNIHFHAPKLWDLVKSRPAMLYFVFNPTVISVLVAHDLESGELVAQVSCGPGFRPRFCVDALKGNGILPLWRCTGMNK